MRRAASSEYAEMRAEITESIAFGAELARDHCQQQFKWDKWNCPDSSFARNKFGLTREQAFVSAVTSAAIVYGVTKTCSRGDMMGCECGPRRGGGSSSAGEKWLWEGCQDPGLGERVSQWFLSSLEGTSVDLLTQTNFHNYRLGRMMVRDNVREECKCHGVSGSCTTKTCWKQLAPFGETAASLKQRYERGLRVDSNSLRPGFDVPHHHLLFLADSPNYCKMNNTTGWEGTAGRVCSREKGSGVIRSERRSCRELCRSCGHQVHSKLRTHTWNCRCNFQWCCQVVCDKCSKTVNEYFCNATPHQI